MATIVEIEVTHPTRVVREAVRPSAPGTGGPALNLGNLIAQAKGISPRTPGRATRVMSAPGLAQASARQALISASQAQNSAPVARQADSLLQSALALSKEELLERLPPAIRVRSQALTPAPDDQRELINRVFQQNELRFRDCAERAKILDPGFKVISDLTFTLNGSGRLASRALVVDGMGTDSSKSEFKRCTQEILGGLTFPKASAQFLYHRAWKI